MAHRHMSLPTAAIAALLVFAVTGCSEETKPARAAAGAEKAPVSEPLPPIPEPKAPEPIPEPAPPPVEQPPAPPPPVEEKPADPPKEPPPVAAVATYHCDTCGKDATVESAAEAPSCCEAVMRRLP